ncbi:MAG: winged helix DNA-binding domain-containing protein, partial [candidate division Zixibacteria bacterium]|nr:winged helix DNA-binding domain-containing protein [candidate division Zixibacteria bacterium]
MLAKKSPCIHLLLPFDHLIIQRERLQQLFGFDYVPEC